MSFMSVERLSLDANILFYTIDADAGERQERAREIVRRAALADCFLTLQTLCEFFASTTRKGKLTPAQAAAHVEDWQSLFPVVAATPGSLRLAMRAVEQHNLSFWDAMQWAVAKQAGATLLLSEDLQHDRELEGVRFRNPFVVEDPFGT
ncbi:MAG TPA: PIN domain-containing protein [Thermoanaerobaculia bacterium]|nr:PIN domain-containing protein [Thermoanaerobaculia bacterium]